MNRLRLASFITAGVVMAPAHAQTISTFAGSTDPHGSATTWGIQPSDAVFDAAGNMYVASLQDHRVLKVDPAGQLTIYAGRGTGGFSGDGGPATAAALNLPRGLALDGAGNLYIADTSNHVIRRVDAVSGIITTVAGTPGTSGFSGDGGPATMARLSAPVGVAVDASGVIYVADINNNRIRKVVGGIITTLAGGLIIDPMSPTGTALFNPDGVAVDASGNLFIAVINDGMVLRLSTSGQLAIVAGTGVSGSGGNGVATEIPLSSPSGIAIDAAGRLLIAERNSNRVRRVDLATNSMTTVAGNGGSGVGADGVAATATTTSFPEDVATDAAGNFYIVDRLFHRVRKVSPSGVIETVAGTPGLGGFTGDGGPATSARLNSPISIASDAAGNLVIADQSNCRLRRVNALTGIITTIAGTGSCSSGPNGILATTSAISFPQAVEIDAAGNVYVTESHRIRRINAADGMITTIAGTLSQGFSGDGGPATSAALNAPGPLAVDSFGNLYISDRSNLRIRRVSGGIIQTVAGNGTLSFIGEGSPATNARFRTPLRPVVGPSGDVYIADSNNSRIRRVNVATGTVTTVAGTVSGFSGDGGPATSAMLLGPQGVSIEAAGNLLIADSGNSRVRRVDAATQLITTVAGNGSTTFNGDGIAATAAGTQPISVRHDSTGAFVIVDTNQARVRRVTAGTITTTAGNGSLNFSGDGEPAVDAQFAFPNGVTVDAAGNVYIADQSQNRVRRVDAASGIVTTVAGNGVQGFGGDGGQASNAPLGAPTRVKVDSAGNLYIAEASNRRVRKVTPAGTITTVAGNGCSGFNGDGIAATAACVFPGDFAFDGAGNLYFPDRGNHRVRRVDAITGIISTVAGNGGTGYNGDNQPATSATLSNPTSIDIDASGNLYIADSSNVRIRKVDASGIISTVAGGGNTFAEGVPATSALFFFPVDVDVDSAGNLYITDSSLNRVRRVNATTQTITTLAGNGSFGFSGDGGLATSAALAQPQASAIRDGQLYIADGFNRRVRKVVGLDNSPPMITPNIGGTLGSNGWYRSNVTLTWTLVDPESGVSSSIGCGPSNVATDTAGMSFTCTATSTGGTSSHTVTIKRDATAPSANASRSPAPNAAGWNDENVTVTFTGNDAMSGIAACSAPLTLTAEGPGQSASGSCTDNAGNPSALASVHGINIDKSAPLATAQRSPAPNANGWHASAVTVSFNGTDTISGIDSCSNPVVLATDGADQSASGSCSDLAGNSASVTEANIDIDTGAPVVSASVDPAPNAAGWNRTTVTVHFSGTDGLSGGVVCDPDVVLANEGLGQSASGSCTDAAGNSGSASAVVRIDKTKPVATGATATAPNASGWFNYPVTVGFTCLDTLSGPVPSSPWNELLTSEGVDQSLTADCRDVADNVSDPVTVSNIDIDLHVPTVDAARTPAANAFGWNNTDVTASFTGSDSLSGVATCTAPTTLSAEGVNQSASGFCTDVAGNVASLVTIAGISIDKTAPTATASVSPAPNANGWHRTNVTVAFAGSDALSGIASCDSNATLTAEGANLSASGSCSDRAGNSHAATAAGIRIDKSAPSVTVSSPQQNATYVLNANVPASYSCADGLSGVASCAGTVANGSPIATSPQGPKTFDVNAADQAGNTAIANRNYNVQYQFVGFHQPVDNLPTINSATSGRTIPIKWNLRDANGTEISAITTFVSLLTSPMACDASPTDVIEEELTVAGSTVPTYSGGHFIFNWKTTKGWTGCRLLQLTLADGAKYSAKFRFK